MRFHKDMLLLYAITEERGNRKRPLSEMVKEVLEGGVTILQLREKHLSDEELMTEALEIKELCHSYGVPLIINDNVDLALRCGADGVHVGIEDTPVAEIRAKAGNDFIIGATAKTVEQAIAAELAGADYIGVGAVFPSPTKQNAVRISNAQLHEITSSVSIPAVAIGGITLGNISQIDCGALSGIAVVSAVFGAKDITQAAKELKAKATALVHS